MKWARTSSGIVIWAMLDVAAGACGSGGPHGACVSSLDCAAGQTCVDARCASPPGASPSALPSTHPSPSPSPSPSPTTGDPDSGADPDRDGLTNAEEARTGTDPQRADTDADGASDLFERAAGTDPTAARDAPPAGAIFVVFDAATERVTRRFDVATRVRASDVYFLIDTSTTMDEEIENLKRTLVSQIIPGVRAQIPDVAFGVGHFDDFRHTIYGLNRGFRAYENRQSMTLDDAAVVRALDGLRTCCAIGDGATIPESGTVALWATATGLGLGNWFPARAECPIKDSTGYPCFRPGALPVIVMVTDAPFHNGPGGSEPYAGITPAPPTFDMATDALNVIGAKVVGVVSEYDGAHATHDVAEAARATGTVTPQGAPIVYEVDALGNGLDASIVQALQELSGNVRRDVHVVAADPDESDAFDPRPLVTRVTPVAAAPPAGVRGQDARAFLGVVPGTTLTFEAELNRGGQAAPPAAGEHHFVHVRLHVLGDATVLLDERDVFVVFARDGATIAVEP